MKRTPLKKMGKDKARETAKYWPLRRDFLEEHPFCEVPAYADKYGSVSCTKRTSSVHHKMGQHWKIMNETRYWLPTCAEHHAWIEANKNEARKRGLILYK